MDRAAGRGAADDARRGPAGDDGARATRRSRSPPSEQGSTFECSLDGAPFAACDPPLGYAGLAPATTCSACARSTPTATRTRRRPSTRGRSSAPRSWRRRSRSARRPRRSSTRPPSRSPRTPPTRRSSARSTARRSTPASRRPSTATSSRASTPSRCARSTARAASRRRRPRREWTVVGPPVTTLQRRTGRDDREPDARFEFSADQAGSTYACSLDGAEPLPCESPVVFIDLGGGDHTFEVDGDELVRARRGDAGACTSGRSTAPPSGRRRRPTITAGPPATTAVAGRHVRVHRHRQRDARRGARVRVRAERRRVRGLLVAARAERPRARRPHARGARGRRSRQRRRCRPRRARGP